MPRIDLLEPLLDGGVRHAHFFNGRVLTAQALQDEQAAVHRHADRLGRAVGEGVADGLAVTAGAVVGGVPTVDVAPGLAVNRKGQTLAVPAEAGPVSVGLTLAPPARALPQGTGRFETCRDERAARGDFRPKVDPGVYVLALGPLSAFQARVPGVAAGGDGVARFCGSRYETEGVAFRLVPLDLGSDALAPGAWAQALAAASARTDDAGRSRFRNLVAHLCLGTGQAGGAARDLFGHLTGAARGAGYGAVDALRAAGRLSDCEVPLAVVRLTAAGLGFVDAWAVRRRLHRPDPPPVSDRPLAEAEAAFHQFEDHLVALSRLGASARLDVRATDFFAYLPPVGVVPVVGGGGTGFDPGRFFDGLTTRDPAFMEGARVPPLLRAGLAFAPVDLARGTFWWRYHVRENRQPAAGRGTPTRYQLFATGALPFSGEAQFDLAAWGFSTFGPGVAPAPGPAPGTVRPPLPRPDL